MYFADLTDLREVGKELERTNFDSCADITMSAKHQTYFGSPTMPMIDSDKLKAASDAVTSALEAWMVSAQKLQVTVDQSKVPAAYEDAHIAHESYHARATDLAQLVCHLIAEAERREKE